MGKTAHSTIRDSGHLSFDRPISGPAAERIGFRLRDARALFRLFVLSIAGLLVTSSAAWAASGTAKHGPRHALVVGNANYPGGRLATPVNDARAMAKKLESIGFKVKLIENVTAGGMVAALDALGQRSGESGISLFYFAGFSVQSPQQVSLLPVDTRVAAGRDTVDQAIPIDRVTKSLDRAGRNASNIIVIDAVPYAAKTRYRGIQVGSMSIATPSNFLIAYSNWAWTREDADKAADQLSPYTKQLLRTIDTPDRTVEEVFKTVRGAISESTNRGHIPWHTSSLLSDVYLVPAAGGGTNLALRSNDGDGRRASRGISVSKQSPPPQAKVEERPAADSKTAQASDQTAAFEKSLWDVVKGSKNPADLEAYLEVFPKGKYAKQARQRISKLRGAKAAKPVIDPPKITAMKEEFAASATANIRERPERSAAVLGKVGRGDKVQVTGRVVGKNWYRVEQKDGSTGYMSTSVLVKRKAAKPKPKPAPKKSQVAVIPPKPSRTSPSIEAGKTFRDCPGCPEMVMIPAGTFRMGSNAGDGSEGPVHTVRIPKSFAIGRYEVTIAEWGACVDAGGCTYKPKIKKASKNAPAHKLSWQDVQQYVAWLSKKTGARYRLPTEAEWEFAARGGSASRYWWGDRMAVGMADCKDCGGKWSYAAPGPVAQTKANPLGLHGVSGGVWEWTEDCWRHGYDRAPTDGSASTAGDCGLRVLRGGSWRNKAAYAHTTSRIKYDFNVRYSTNGFRVVRELR